MTDLTVYEIDSFDDIEEIVQIDIENDETVSEFLGGPAPESRDIEELTVPAAGSHAETESDRFVTTAYNSFSKFVESFDD